MVGKFGELPYRNSGCYFWHAQYNTRWVDKQIKHNREDTQRTIEILREDAKDDKERLLNEIAYNREVIAKVVATNDVLAKDLTVKVDKILDKVGV